MGLGLLWMPIFALITFMAGICRKFFKPNSIYRWALYAITFGPIIFMSVGYAGNTWNRDAPIPLDIGSIIVGALAASVPFGIGVLLGKPIFEAWRDQSSKKERNI